MPVRKSASSAHDSCHWCDHLCRVGQSDEYYVCEYDAKGISYTNDELGRALHKAKRFTCSLYSRGGDFKIVDRNFVNSHGSKRINSVKPVLG